MAKFKGNDGTVEIGGTVFANIISVTLDEGVNIIGSTTVTDDSDTHEAGTKNWSASIECYWDDTDTSGQGAATNGASATFNFLPEGATTGDYQKSGTGTVSGLSTSHGLNNMVTASFTVTGNGALTTGTHT